MPRTSHLPLLRHLGQTTIFYISYISGLHDGLLYDPGPKNTAGCRQAAGQIFRLLGIHFAGRAYETTFTILHIFLLATTTCIRLAFRLAPHSSVWAWTFLYLENWLSKALFEQFFGYQKGLNLYILRGAGGMRCSLNQSFSTGLIHSQLEPDDLGVLWI